MRLADIYVVLTDISGYTDFTHAHAPARLHAEKIVSDLLETVIARTGQPLIVNKLEGDAVLAYADAEDADRAGHEILRQLPSMMEAFRARRDELIYCNVCWCEACRSMGDLRLKAVVHRGVAVMKSVGRFEEIGGESVIVAHRLLKNAIPEHEYILVTDAARAHAPAPPGFSERKTVEHVNGIGDVAVWVMRPDGAARPPEPKPALRPGAWLRGAAYVARLDAYAIGRALFGAEKARPKPLDR